MRVQDILWASILNVAVHDSSSDEQSLWLVLLLLVQVKNFSYHKISVENWNLNFNVRFFGGRPHGSSRVSSLMDDDACLLLGRVLHIVTLLVDVFHRLQSHIA